jgi:hypothetical protein
VTFARVTGVGSQVAGLIQRLRASGMRLEPAWPTRLALHRDCPSIPQGLLASSLWKTKPRPDAACRGPDRYAAASPRHAGDSSRLCPSFRLLLALRRAASASRSGAGSFLQLVLLLRDRSRHGARIWLPACSGRRWPRQTFLPPQFWPDARRSREFPCQVWLTPAHALVPGRSGCCPGTDPSCAEHR